MTNGQSDGKSFAYLIGVYLGDGCVTTINGKDRFRLNTIDKDFADATASAIETLTGKSYAVCGPYMDKRFSKSRPQYQIACYDASLCARLKAETNGKLMMPAWIFDAEHDVRLAFIAGLFDSEGFVSYNPQNWTNRRFFMGFKSCDVWVPEFVKLLESTGIRIGKLMTEEPRKAHYKRPWSFRVKMQSWIDAGAYFNCSRKQSRVEEWSSLPAYAMRDAKAIPNEHTPGSERT